MTDSFDLGIEISSGNWWLGGCSRIATIIRGAKRKTERKRVQILLSAWERRGELPNTLPLKITLVRVMGRGQREFDGDNLQVGFKHIRDEIAKRCGLDDADPRITWEYAQERGDSASSRMIVAPLDGSCAEARG